MARVEYAEPAAVQVLSGRRLLEFELNNHGNDLNVNSSAAAVAAKLILANGSALHLTPAIHARETSLLAVQPSAVPSAGSAERLLVDFLADDITAATARPRHVDVAFQLAVVDAETRLSAKVT